MSSDIETFLCMVQYTEYMNNLIFHSGKEVEEFEEEITILNSDRKFKKIKEIVQLNNYHINNAIKELLRDKENVNCLIQNTNITKEEIDEVIKMLK